MSTRALRAGLRSRTARPAGGADSPRELATSTPPRLRLISEHGHRDARHRAERPEVGVRQCGDRGDAFSEKSDVIRASRKPDGRQLGAHPRWRSRSVAVTGKWSEG